MGHRATLVERSTCKCIIDVLVLLDGCRGGCLALTQTFETNLLLIVVECACAQSFDVASRLMGDQRKQPLSLHQQLLLLRTLTDDGEDRAERVQVL